MIASKWGIEGSHTNIEVGNCFLDEERNSLFSESSSWNHSSRLGWACGCHRGMLGFLN